MKILFASAEVAPFAKVGGLADVAGSLPKALNKLGHETIVVMPAYGYVVDNPEYKIELIKDDFFVRVNDSRFVKAKLFKTEVTGFTTWLIDGENYFSKSTKSEEVYAFGREDYLFFAQAALEACQDMGWMPDIVHAHDWHMGFLPVLLRETRQDAWNTVASAFTIHNLAYQGWFGYDTLQAAGLSHDLWTMDKLETFGSVNFLKSGCVFADMVNTVSQKYANEIQTAEFGCGLEGVMEHLHAHHRLAGILNGIDTDVFNPESDPHIAANFSAQKPEGKTKCRKALIAEAGLQVTDQNPILAVISRLSDQKGFDLMVAAADRMLATGAAYVVLGTGDPWAAGELRRLEAEHPGKVKFFEAFDPELAQRIYSGADIFLMPSAFEPCGLGQMFAMRYGTVPVVRHTGGLADTVFEDENGFVYYHQNAEEFAQAVERAVNTFSKPEEWQKLVNAGMTHELGWDNSANRYAQFYAQAIDHRMASNSTQTKSQVR